MPRMRLSGFWERLDVSGRHNNIAIFVPHNGCPHLCSFCNQRTISGHDSQPSPDDVERAINIAAEHRKPGYVTELAFFGGSFTAIDRDYMLSLLAAAQPYYKSGQIDGIRCSTRPDCIDADILELLRRYNVTAIELGAQSMRDSVLAANHRGHTSADVVRASEMIRSYGFELGLQMMTGLYMSGAEDDIYTSERLIELKPDTVRIYPTVVLRGTELERLYNEGKYSPPDAYQSAPLCARLIEMFEKNGVKVIRVGLHAEKSLEENYIAGAYHPAMRELCESAFFLRRMRELLDGFDKSARFDRSSCSGRNACSDRCVYFAVNPKDLSKAVGQKRGNISLLKAEGYDIKITADKKVDEGDIVCAAPSD